MLRALSPQRMRTIALVAAAACLLSCADTDPAFGDPGAISKQNFPGETTGSSSGGGDGGGAVDFAPFPKAYDEADPPKETRTGKQIHEGKASIDATTDCTTCHGATPVAGAPKFAFAGLAFSAPGSTTPLEFGEVIVYTPDNKVFATVKTTSDGYFSFLADNGAVPANAKTAVRDKANKVQKMTASLGGSGACNSTGCHGGGAGRIDFKP